VNLMLIKRTISILGLLALSSGLYAVEPKEQRFFVGQEFFMANIEQVVDYSGYPSDEFDYSGYGTAINLGYYLSSRFYVDLGYYYTKINNVDVGSNSEPVDALGGKDPSWDMDGGKIRLVYEQPITDMFSVYAGVGVATWDLEDKYFSFSGKSTLALLGVAAERGRWRFSGSYEHQKLEDGFDGFDKLENFSVAVNYKFDYKLLSLSPAYSSMKTKLPSTKGVDSQDKLAACDEKHKRLFPMACD